MKTTVSEYDFERAFVDMGRKDNFSYEGRKALYNYLIDFEEDTGQEIGLDVIAICCEFSEYSDIKELKADYFTEEEYDDMPDDKVLNELRDNTQVIELDNGGIIIQQY